MQDLQRLVLRDDRELPEDSLLRDLRMSTFSGTEDDYGKEAVPLGPESLLEARLIVSTAKLSNLPTELLAKVVAEIPSESLNNLALMNKDCWQIARSLQFASVLLNFSTQSWELLRQLGRESVERANPADSGRTNKLELGQYIRCLTVTTSNEWLSHWYEIKPSDRFGALPQTERSRQLQTSKEYFRMYLRTIEHLLDDQTTLPNLQLLNWDTAPVHPYLLDVITNSKIKHLKLSCVRVQPMRAISLPHSWPLQSLHLETKPLEYERTLDLSTLSLSLLLYCSSHLKLLTWVSHHNKDTPPISTDHLKLIPTFPLLRHLRLSNLRLADTTLLRMLVHDNLVSLEVDPNWYQNFFNDRGRINELKLFVCNTPSARIPICVAFLRDNKHISKLATSPPLPKLVIEARILPLLARSFLWLRSLSMAWAEEEQDISDHALVLISQITSLEQLHLSVGIPEGWQSIWSIDSGKMRHYLSRLPLLKKLAFTNDAYLPHRFEIDHETDEGTDEDEGIDEGEAVDEDEAIDEDEAVDEDEAIDEDEFVDEHHRHLARVQAVRYFRTMRRLKWLFIGQIPWAVEEDADGVKQLVEIPRSHIKDYWTVLNEMFGWRGMSVWKSA
ncbi:MAG: hypothetical protein L6R38_006498 [Xanthoria sp. 2 TBL-2021]|nr:MAG: hypothetical protein L6R38_006498 [Xanthoria sp. 2 TBL-2021]